MRKGKDKEIEERNEGTEEYEKTVRKERWKFCDTWLAFSFPSSPPTPHPIKKTLNDSSKYRPFPTAP